MPSPEARLDALAAAYLQPWSSSGVSQALVDEAHLKWADYRDRQWGSYVPLGTSHNRLLRVNVIGNKLYFYTCAGRHSKRRLARQRAALELLQTVLDARTVPDVDFVLGISDHYDSRGDGVARAAAARVRVRRDGGAPQCRGRRSRSPRHWRQLYDGAGAAAPRSARRQRALWRGSCNSLCDEGGRLRLAEDRALSPRRAAPRRQPLPGKTDVGLAASPTTAALLFASPTAAGAVEPLRLPAPRRRQRLLGPPRGALTLGGVILKQHRRSTRGTAVPGPAAFSLAGANASGAPSCATRCARYADAARAERLAAAAPLHRPTRARARYYVSALLATHRSSASAAPPARRAL